VRRRVAVVTDSTAALPPGVAQRWGLTVVPLDVVVDGTRYAESALPPGRLVTALHAGAKVSTSQPPPEAFARAYARLASQGASAVVSVHLSGELSGTVAAAHSAAERAPLPVHVVDSRSAAMGLGFAALAAAWTAAGVPDAGRLVAEHGSSTPLPSSAPSVPGAPRSSFTPRAPGRGVLDLAALRRLPDLLRRQPPPDAEEVAVAARDAAAAARVWFLVDSLEHLRRGGRLSAPAAALGTVLGLRPLLTVSDGKVVVGEKIRTRRAARERLEAVAVAAAVAHARVRVAVHHLGEPDAADVLAGRLAAELGERVREVVVADSGAVLGAHAGPGLLAVVIAPA
jgi:fatty acid-binding protein DegV